MSTAEQQAVHVSAVPAVVPPAKTPRLENGDRLSSKEFERRYSAMPGLKKVELIEGIVYMPSPVRHPHHGKPHGMLLGWLAYYASKTPQVEFNIDTTFLLDGRNQPQPDAMLLMPKGAGGGSWIDEQGFVCGAPDWLGEVAASTVNIDLHKKLEVYQRSGVREYLVVRTEDQAVDWFELRNGNYEAMAPGEDGLVRSQVFPGLWLDPVALLAGDLPKLFAAIDQGTATEAHREFVKKLQQA